MKTKILITLVAFAIVIGHRIWPDIKVDSITIIFIVIAILPWFAPIIKSLELPGGFKIELQDIRSATTKVVGFGSAKLPGIASTAIGTALSKTEQTVAMLRNV